MNIDPSRLVDDAAFMRSILESSNDCIKVLDLDGTLIFMNAGGQHVMEVDDFSTLRGCHWPDFWPANGGAKAQHAVESARGGKTVNFEGEAPTAKGSMRYWEVVVSPIFGEDGVPMRILSVSRDVTSRKQIEMQRETLANELLHRVNNTLAVVSAIVSQSLRAASTIADAENSIAGRIRALSRASSLLTQGSTINTNVADIVRESVRPYIDFEARVTMAGGDIELNSRAGSALALTINELSTNATKYGALSNATGSVQIFWETLDDHLRLTWRETGGPAISAPTRTSFGTMLINTMFRQQLGGSVDMQFEPGGLVCILDAPLSTLTNERQESAGSPREASGQSKANLAYSYTQTFD